MHAFLEATSHELVVESRSRTDASVNLPRLCVNENDEQGCVAKVELTTLKLGVCSKTNCGLRFPIDRVPLLSLHAAPNPRMKSNCGKSVWIGSLYSTTITIEASHVHFRLKNSRRGEPSSKDSSHRLFTKIGLRNYSLPTPACVTGPGHSEALSVLIGVLMGVRLILSSIY